MPHYHIAQVNIGRIRAELDDPIMAGFVNRLDEIVEFQPLTRDEVRALADKAFDEILARLTR